MRIYLAGPISGYTHDESEEWRDEFKALMPPSIKCYSPLRGKRFLREKGVITQSYSDTPFSTDKGILARDHDDCRRADLIVANLVGAEKISIGTVMEIAWGHAYRNPVLAIMDPGSVHDHPMIREAVSYRASTVYEAAEMAKTLLIPDWHDVRASSSVKKEEQTVINNFWAASSPLGPNYSYGRMKVGGILNPTPKRNHGDPV